MTIDLVGHTGLVGSNLALSFHFDHSYNSKNIEDAYGTSPDILVYAGIPGTKYLANKSPQSDWTVIEKAMENITKIMPQKLILISTIDTYHRPDGQTEDSTPFPQRDFAYGYHRRQLEIWVQHNIKNHLIVRLPGVYGENLKKNFIYDLIEPIPQALSEATFFNLSHQDKRMRLFYGLGKDGFYHPTEELIRNRHEALTMFEMLSFSSLKFTDSRGVFQYYNLNQLWQHINIALNNGIKLLHIATEPFTTSELHTYLTGKTYCNELDGLVPFYNFKTKYDELFDGKNGYIFSKEQIMSDIKNFITSHKCNH